MIRHWVDAMVRIQGPATEALAAIFLADWRIESDESLADLQATGNFHSVDDHGECVVHVIPSGPRNNPETIHEMLLTTIYSARRELVITTPYFVPDEAMKTAIVSAARRGVDVTIVLPARVDSFLVRYASRAAYQELIDAGVHLRFYQGGLLHSKTITVDRSIALVGSVNLDMRSFWLNFEITLFVFDADFTSRLLATQQAYLDDSTHLDLDWWNHRGAPRRLVENVIRLMGPVL